MKNSKIVTLVFIALFSAIQIVLEFTNQFVPSLPQGGSISYSIIAIFLASYLLGVKEGILVGFVSSILQFALGMASFYGWWSVLLDYVLPLSLCGMAGLIKNVKFKKMELPIGVIFAMVLKFIPHYLSGAVLFGEYAGDQNPYLYSLTYNLSYNIPTLIVCFILVMLVYPKLSIYFKKFDK